MVLIDTKHGESWGRGTHHYERLIAEPQPTRRRVPVYRQGLYQLFQSVYFLQMTPDQIGRADTRHLDIREGTNGLLVLSRCQVAR